jgi:hypothetical protein
MLNPTNDPNLALISTGAKKQFLPLAQKVSMQAIQLQAWTRLTNGDRLNLLALAAVANAINALYAVNFPNAAIQT